MIKNDKWFQHEGLDRTHTILVMLDQLLGYGDDSEDTKHHLHPSIWNKECENLLREATRNLAELYQKIGEWKEGGESTKSKT